MPALLHDLSARYDLPSTVDQVLLFVNPIAGRGRGRQIAQVLGDRLSRRGWGVRVFLGRAEQASDQALREPARAVVVVGGDGTLRTVAMRLYRARAAADPGTVTPLPPILIVPLGTANLMGQHLGVRWDTDTLGEDVAACIERGRVIEIDAATANNVLFLLVAGVGFDAMIVHELDRVRTGPITLLNYALPAGLALQQYDYAPLTVTADNAVLCQDLPALAFVGNIAEYGTGFPVLPLARPDDGLLDVCILPCRSRRDLMHLLLLTAAGEHLSAEGVLYTKARRVRVDAPAPLPVQVDGEAAGHTPLSIDLLPRRIPFMVPG